MKLHILTLLLLTVTVVSEEANKQTWLNFGKGFFDGLHFEHLSANMMSCRISINATITAFSNFINGFGKSQPFYNYVNNLTLALGKIPKTVKFCMVTPNEVWEGIKKIYINNFDGSLTKYLKGILINMVPNLDVVLYNIMATKENIGLGEYYSAGHFVGTLINFVLNVTGKAPIPPPPKQVPVKKVIISRWDGPHDKFREIVNYTMITLRYTRFINETTFNNFNSSLMTLEMNVYTIIKLLSNKEIGEAAFLAMESLEELNSLWNGLYFTFVQVPRSLIKNTIFQYYSYALTNLVLHSSNLLWNMKALYFDLQNGDYMEVARRISVIIRKIIYLEEDTLEEIRLKSPSDKLIQPNP